MAEIPKKKKKFSQKCITYVAPKIYNLLPIDLKNHSLTSYQYKRNCKGWLHSVENGMLKDVLTPDVYM